MELNKKLMLDLLNNVHEKENAKHLMQLLYEMKKNTNLIDFSSIYYNKFLNMDKMIQSLISEMKIQEKKEIFSFKKNLLDLLFNFNPDLRKKYFENEYFGDMYSNEINNPLDGVFGYFFKYSISKFNTLNNTLNGAIVTQKSIYEKIILFNNLESISGKKINKTIKMPEIQVLEFRLKNSISDYQNVQKILKDFETLESLLEYVPVIIQSFKETKKEMNHEIQKMAK